MCTADAVVRPDNTFEVRADGVQVAQGHLAEDEDFVQPLNPPREIDDADDEKPLDWVDEQMVGGKGWLRASVC